MTPAFKYPRSSQVSLFDLRKVRAIRGGGQERVRQKLENGKRTSAHRINPNLKFSFLTVTVMSQRRDVRTDITPNYHFRVRRRIGLLLVKNFVKWMDRGPVFRRWKTVVVFNTC